MNVMLVLWIFSSCWSIFGSKGAHLSNANASRTEHLGRALLAGCRKHRNLDAAEIAAGKLFVLEPENSGNYVLLSNMYAEAGMWEVNNLRALLKC
ncbi:hypothetical protein ACSBR2_018710 [Camellia fascicularis]